MLQFRYSRWRYEPFNVGLQSARKTKKIRRRKKEKKKNAVYSNNKLCVNYCLVQYGPDQEQYGPDQEHYDTRMEENQNLEQNTNNLVIKIEELHSTGITTYLQVNSRILTLNFFIAQLNLKLCSHEADLIDFNTRICSLVSSKLI